MEPFRAERREPDPLTVIRRWPRPQGGDDPCGGLKDEAKTVWSYLFSTAGGVDCSRIVYAGQIAFETARTDQGAWRALKSLAREGLIDIRDRDRRTGAIAIYLQNPVEVAKARLKPGTGHGQGLLWADEPQPCPQEEVPALRIGPGTLSPVEPAADGAAGAMMAPAANEEVAPDIPPSSGAARRITPPDPAPIPGDPRRMTPPDPAPAPLIEGLRLIQGLRSNARANNPIEGLRGEVAPDHPPSSGAIAEGLPTKERVRLLRQIADLKAKDRAPPLLAGAVDGAILKLPSLEARLARVEDYVRFMLSRVADPKLQRGPCEKVAWAIVEGVLPEAKLHEVLRYLDKNAAEGKLEDERWVCFVGTIKKQFFRLHIPWTPKPKEESEKPC
jgi:hypothetical protein